MFYNHFEVDNVFLGHLKGDAVAVWYDGGRRRRYRLGPGLSQGDAENALRRFVRERNAGQQATAGVTCQDLYERYIAERRRDGRPTRHAEITWRALAPTFGHVAPADVNRQLCREYERQRLAAGRKPGTVWTDLTDLRAILMWGHHQRPVPLVPLRPVVYVPVKPEPQNLSLDREQFGCLLAAAEAPHLRLFLVLALTTAGRASAILELTWDRVDFARSLIDLYDPGQARTAKGRALVPLNTSARQHLLQAHAVATTPYVIEYLGRPIGDIKRAISTAARRAGLGWVTPHVLRHTAARLMAEAGVPMSQIAQYLGHSSTSITEKVYARYSPDFLRGAAAAVEI